MFMEDEAEEITGTLSRRSRTEKQEQILMTSHRPLVMPTSLQILQAKMRILLKTLNLFKPGLFVCEVEFKIQAKPIHSALLFPSVGLRLNLFEPFRGGFKFAIVDIDQFDNLSFLRISLEY